MPSCWRTMLAPGSQLSEDPGRDLGRRPRLPVARVDAPQDRDQPGVADAFARGRVERAVRRPHQAGRVRPRLPQRPLGRAQRRRDLSRRLPGHVDVRPGVVGDEEAGALHRRRQPRGGRHPLADHEERRRDLLVAEDPDQVVGRAVACRTVVEGQRDPPVAGRRRRGASRPVPGAASGPRGGRSRRGARRRGCGTARERHGTGGSHARAGRMGIVRDVVILGSTGSIGTQALDIVRANPDRFRVVGLTAGGGNRELFERQVAEVAAATTDSARRHRSRRRSPVTSYSTASPVRSVSGRRSPRSTPAAPSRWPTRSPSSSAARSSRSVLSRARSCRSTASTARSPRACAAAAATRYDASCSPRAAARSAAAPVPTSSRHAGAGARPPQLRDGPRDHDQLGDPGQQGPRGDRGPPALRRAVRPDRRGRPPAAAHPLDGRVRRRRGRGPDRPPDHAGPDRARDGLARPGARRRAAVDWTRPRTGASTRSTMWRSRPSSWRGRGAAGSTAPAVYNAANEVCVDAFHEGRLRFPGIVDDRCRARRPRRTLGGAAHARRRPRRGRVGAPPRTISSEGTA